MKLSANIELLFAETGPDYGERVRAAAAAGFDAVDIWWQSNKDLPALRRALDDTGVSLTTLVVEGYSDLPDPTTHDAFLAKVALAAESAQFLGCPYLVTGSGAAKPSSSRAAQHDIVVGVLRRAARIAEEHGVTVILENLNTRVDHPGILFDTTAECVAAVRHVDSAGLALLFDLYHSTQMGETLTEELAGNVDVLAHVQASDAPGRTEPGSGTIDWAARLGDLLDLGYAGSLTLEYRPSGDTRTSVAHIQEVAAGLRG